jgi:hypothetical protein
MLKRLTHNSVFVDNYEALGNAENAGIADNAVNGVSVAGVVAR